MLVDILLVCIINIHYIEQQGKNGGSATTPAKDGGTATTTTTSQTKPSTQL